MDDIYPFQHLPPLWASIAAHVAVTGSIFFIAIAALLAIRHRRRARRLSSLIPTARVAASRDALLCGTVESDAEAAPLVVEITQQYRPCFDSPEGSMAWMEVARTVTGHPFDVRISADQRIQVEPDGATILIGPPLETISVDPDTRIRRTELKAGSSVHVKGAIVSSHDLDAAYRGGSKLIMRSGPALVVSTVGLGQPSKIRARRYARIAAAACLLSVVNFVLYDYFRLRYCSVVVRGEVTRLRTLSEPDKDGGTSKHFMVELQILPGQPHAGYLFEREVWQADYSQLRRGMWLPVRLIIGAPASARLGSRASFNIGLLIPLFFGLVITAAVFGLTARRPAGWWEFPLNEG